jgi:hypothetical protein
MPGRALSKLLLVALAAATATTVLPGAATAAEASDAVRIAQLRRRLAQLSSEADRIADANAVKRLQRAYGFYLDKGYWDEAADLFADDATMEVGIDGVYVGKARIRELIIRHGGGNPGPGLPFGQLNLRMQLQPLVTVAANGLSAKGRWRELSMTGQFQQSASWGEGVYENEYVKDKGVWKISRLRFYPNFVAPYEIGWAGLVSTTQDWRSEVAKRFPPDRPPTRLYQPFPAPFTPPFHYRNPVTRR